MHTHAIQRAPEHRLGQGERVVVAGTAGTCGGGWERVTGTSGVEIARGPSNLTPPCCLEEGNEGMCACVCLRVWPCA